MKLFIEVIHRSIQKIPQMRIFTYAGCFANVQTFNIYRGLEILFEELFDI